MLFVYREVYLYPAIVKNRLHMTPKHTDYQKISTPHVHTHTHPVTCQYKGLIWSHKQVQSLVLQHAATLFHNCREIHTHSPASAIANLPDAFIAILLPAVH